MNRRFTFIITDDKTSCLSGLILCGALFLCGCVAGTFSSAFVQDGSALTQYFSEYLSLEQDGSFIDPSFFSVLFDTFRYPAIVFSLGFSMLGIIGIPALAGAKGYMLAFSVSVMVRLYGGNGVLLALSLFAVSALITVPCFLILSAMTFRASCRLSYLVVKQASRGGAGLYDMKYFISCLICFGLFTGAAVLDTYLTAAMVRFAAGYIC